VVNISHLCEHAIQMHRVHQGPCKGCEPQIMQTHGRHLARKLHIQQNGGEISISYIYGSNLVSDIRALNSLLKVLNLSEIPLASFPLPVRNTQFCKCISRKNCNSELTLCCVYKTYLPKKKKNRTPWPLVHKRAIPTENRHLLAKFSANFCG
jgi:hypothetical protein